jgi:DNA-binding SARP family transcriptional activator
LRSALWRVRRDCPGLIEIDDRSLQLTPSAATDLKYLEAASLFVEDEVRTPRLMQWDHRVLGRELLPSWYDEWVVVARERVRQLSLHTLESLADRLCADHRFASAVQSALGAIRLDPFRESARRALIRIHLAEGNHAEALRVHDEYADLLQAELGLHPSDRMAELMCRVHRSA